MDISTIEDLDSAIAELQQKKIATKEQLAADFHELHESIRPINLLKSGIQKITAPGDIRSTLLKAAGGLGMGLLTKGIISGKTGGAIGSMVGNTLKATVSNTIYQNADKIKAYGLAIYHNLFGKGKKK